MEAVLYAANMSDNLSLRAGGRSSHTFDKYHDLGLCGMQKIVAQTRPSSFCRGFPIWGAGRGPLEMRVGQPIPTAGLTTRDLVTLSNKVQAELESLYYSESPAPIAAR